MDSDDTHVTPHLPPLPKIGGRFLIQKGDIILGWHVITHGQIERLENGHIRSGIWPFSWGAAAILSDAVSSNQTYPHD